MVFLTVKHDPLTVRLLRALGKKCSVREEVCERCSENMEPVTQADDCQSTWSGDQSSRVTNLVLVGIEYTPEKVITSGRASLSGKAWKSQSANLTQLANEKPISKAINGKQQKKEMISMKNTDFFRKSTTVP